MRFRLERGKCGAGVVAAGIALLGVPAVLLAQPGDALYSNTTTKTGQAYAPASGTEFGNEVFITDSGAAGEGSNPQWFIAGLSFEYNSGTAAVGSPVGRAVLNIYADTGPLTAGPGSQSPGPIALYTSPSFNLLGSGTSGALATFTGLSVVVPSTFTWTVTFTSANGASLGLDIYGPPTVGNAYNDIWQKTGSTWELLAPNGTVQGNGTPANYATFGAQFSTESFSIAPEPGTLSLAVMGLAALSGTAMVRRGGVSRVPRRKVAFENSFKTHWVAP